MDERILIVAAHSDDETLGSGATLRRHVDSGDEVFAVSLTDGVGSRDDVDGEALSERNQAAAKAAEILGFEWLRAGTFPDNAIDSVPLLEVVKFVEQVKREIEPTIVYAHHGGDLNIDHRLAFQATLTAFRPQPGEQLRELRTFEVASSTEWSDETIGTDFSPNLFVDVSEQWVHKKEALEAYSSEMRTFPHSRSYAALDALAMRRGNQVGLERAEAFRVIRRIVT